MSGQEQPAPRWVGFAVGAARTAALLAVGTLGGYLLALHHVACAAGDAVHQR